SAKRGAWAGGAHTWWPARWSTRTTYRGSTTAPRLSNTVYADTRSTGRTALAPMALDGYGAIGVSMPSRLARAITVSMPTCRPNWTAIGLRDRTSPSRIVMRPWKRPSALPGRYTLPLGIGIARAESSMRALGGMLSRSALAYTISLNAEPGWRRAFTARLKGEAA